METISTKVKILNPCIIEITLFGKVWLTVGGKRLLLNSVSINDDIRVGAHLLHPKSTFDHGLQVEGIPSL